MVAEAIAISTLSAPGATTVVPPAVAHRCGDRVVHGAVGRAHPGRGAPHELAQARVEGDGRDGVGVDSPGVHDIDRRGIRQLRLGECQCLGDRVGRCRRAAPHGDDRRDRPGRNGDRHDVRQIHEVERVSAVCRLGQRQLVDLGNRRVACRDDHAGAREVLSVGTQRRNAERTTSPDLRGLHRDRSIENQNLVVGGVVTELSAASVEQGDASVVENLAEVHRVVERLASEAENRLAVGAARVADFEDQVDVPVGQDRRCDTRPLGRRPVGRTRRRAPRCGFSTKTKPHRRACSLARPSSVCSPGTCRSTRHQRRDSLRSRTHPSPRGRAEPTGWRRSAASGP